MPEIRPYQREFVSSVIMALEECSRVLGVAPTGSGKTVMAGEIIRLSSCNVLFLADAKELVYQAADKLGKWAGVIADVEMADNHAMPGSRLVVATTQSIARRLDKYPRDAFGLVIVDEAHRNTMGAQAQSVLEYFSSAKVIGITATPFRSDKKELGSFYERIASEIGLVRLIKEGFLSRITIHSVPTGIDLRGIRTVAGDYREDDLGAAITPHLDRLAQLLAQHAWDRRTVAFLPLRETSRQFVAACNQYGLRAIHVDGDDRDGIARFRAGEFDVVSNASLLTTGWDEPSVDCVYICRPTQSFVLYSQMVGRGTRIHPGKQDLLVLDPLFLSDSHKLIRPARLVAKTEEDEAEISRVIEEQGVMDIFDAEERAQADRAERLRERMEEVARRKSRMVDAMEFALSLGADELADYSPETEWEARALTDKQAALLEKAGLDVQTIQGRGHASKIIDLLFTRRSMGLATPKQIKWLRQFRHPSPNTATFEEATAFLDGKFKRKTEAA